MGSFDLFVASLRCPHCDAVARAEIQTKLRGDASDQSMFAVGDHFTYDLADAADWGYLVVQPPAQPVHFGQMWECAVCKHYPSWAEVVIDDDRIASIDAIALDAAALARLHFLDEDAAPFIADAVAVEAADAWDELIPLLRAWLAADPKRAL
ncbi:MAG TPA: hypothetical protein VGM88_33615 [Kofleriaceae bacterium]|jgi:hypothetical protein